MDHDHCTSDCNWPGGYYDENPDKVLDRLDYPLEIHPYHDSMSFLKEKAPIIYRALISLGLPEIKSLGSE